MNCPTIHDRGKPGKLVGLIVVTGVTGEQQEVNRLAGCVNPIRRANDAVENLGRVRFPRPPGSRDQVMCTREPARGFGIDRVRIGHVDKTCDQRRPCLAWRRSLAFRQQRRYVRLAGTAQQTDGT